MDNIAQFALIISFITLSLTNVRTVERESYIIQRSWHVNVLKLILLKHKEAVCHVIGLIISLLVKRLAYHVRRIISLINRLEIVIHVLLISPFLIRLHVSHVLIIHFLIL